MARREKRRTAEKSKSIPNRAAKTKQMLRRRIRTVALAVTLICALLAVGVFFYVFSTAQKANQDTGRHFAESTIPEEEITGLQVGYENVDATSLNEFISKWATNNIQLLHDKNILNILLCGVDSTDGNALMGRSDSIMLVSVNKKAKAITITSFYRDSYSFIDLTKNIRNPRTIYDRVNSAYSLGGPATLVETIENNYKIKIDDYICVDFNSFPKVINALGGVTVDVQDYEARYINKTAPSMNGNFPAGENVLLNGSQALVYSRIRKLDSDMDRAQRQRKVIQSILASAQKASVGKVKNAVDVVLPYITTNMTSWEITSLSTTALAQGWLNYSITQNNSPTLECENATGVSTYIRQMFVWVVDYPRAAQELQKQIYNVTNIQLLVGGEAREGYISEIFNLVNASYSATKNASESNGKKSSSNGSAVTNKQTESEETETETTAEQSETTKDLLWWLKPSKKTTVPETEVTVSTNNTNEVSE